MCLFCRLFHGFVVAVVRGDGRGGGGSGSGVVVVAVFVSVAFR